jgi:hypothetical protein
MKFNKLKLYGRMREKEYTKSSLGKECGINRDTFSRRINGLKLSLKDMHVICERLGLSNEDVLAIFFDREEGKHE